MAETKARLYKYVTPPTFSGKGGGITVKVGGKTITQPQVGFVKNIKAINSLGATTNSIAVLVEDMSKSFKGFYVKTLGLQQGLLDSREDALADEKKLLKTEKREDAKAAGLEQDKKAEDKQEGKGKRSSIGEKSKAIAARSLGFFAGLASLFGGIFKSMLLYGLMDWLGDPQNIKKVKKLLGAIKSIGQWFINTYGALVKMGLNGLVDFLENPLSLEGVFGIIKFVTALGLIFAPAAVAKLGLGLFFKLAKGGGLVKGVAGFVSTLFKSVTSVFKGMFAFVKGRGLWVAGAFLAGTAVAAAAGAFNEDPSDESVEKSVAEIGEEETEKQLQKQLESLNFIQKMLGKDKPIQQQLDKLEGKAIGGQVGKASGGGWINGPQSGYPVSLDGGRSTSFIGHGTEWVGKRSSGGDAFVVPFDTPATRGGNGLTNMRMQQAKAGGYGLPAFAKGGKADAKRKVQIRKRTDAPGEDRLAGMDRMAKGGKMFLHWTASGGNFKSKGKYHSIVQGDGSIFRAHPYDQRGGVEHTYLRNSTGIGLSLAAMSGGPGNFRWPSDDQITSMSKEIANIAKDRGWRPEEINVKNVMTHAEAASGKDGLLPKNDNYGPTAWGGDGNKWDLWHLTKNGEKGSGGNIIRAKARGFMGGDSTVAESSGSVAPVKGAKTTVSSSSGSTTTSSGASSMSPGAGATVEEAQYKSTGAIMDFFGKSTGMLTQYASDAGAMDGFSSGGKWSPVLDLIALGESKNSGGYDAMNPGRNTKAEGNPITSMTMREVRDMAMSGSGTGAAGRYQIMPEYNGSNVFKKLVEDVGLNYDTDKFTPANQDKMAVYRIEHTRGGNDWLAGKYPGGDVAFANNLANEWAALQKSHGGGAYDGDGRNHASISQSKLMQAMQKTKSGGYPKFDANKKYKTGDIVMKDGSPRIFDGRGWGAADGVGPTAQGTSADTLKATVPSTGSGDPNHGGEEKQKKPVTFESVMEHIGSKMGLLGQYAKDASAMDGVTPSGKDSASDLLTSMQKKEDAATAEAKQGGGVTAATLPTQGGGGDQVASAAPKSSGGGGQPYIIPANDYARPRFGLTSEIFNEPVSIA